MTLWVIIPAKSLGAGKSRLADVLPQAERTVFNEKLLRRTIGVAVAVTGAAHTLVVSADAAVAKVAGGCGVGFVPEPAPELNAALEHAAGVVRSRGATAILTLAADLPLLEAGDVEAMIAAARNAGVVIAPDRAGTGTNALLMSPPGVVPFWFGPGSAEAFRAAAARAGASFAALQRPGLAFDLDTPEDLAELGVRDTKVSRGL
jgi:2-phospho-L-lactate guanylyltransferase